MSAELKEECQRLSEKHKGKVIESFECPDDGDDCWAVIFTDGSKLYVRFVPPMATNESFGHWKDNRAYHDPAHGQRIR